MTDISSRWASVYARWLTVLVAALFCLMVIVSQQYINLSLQDEGFLWYGAQRLLHSEIPIRDFQAYDPGRYFWVASGMVLSGQDGILAVRWADAILASISVALATWVVASSAASARRVGFSIATVAIFTLWMIPHYKAADSFAAIILLFGLTRLLRRPSLRRFFETGIYLGLASTIGINHALYGCVAVILTLFCLRKGTYLLRALASIFAGGLLGYSPVIALHVFAPGFTAAFLDSIRQLSEAGTTNLSLPFPDLLGVLHVSERSVLGSVTQTLSALLFLGVPLLWLRIAWHLRRTETTAIVNPAVLAGSILSIPYSHYAYSRSDVIHIAVSILPVLVALLAWITGVMASRRRQYALIGMFGVSLVMTAHEHPAYYFFMGDRTQTLEIDGERLSVAANDATEIRAAQIIAQRAGRGDFFVGPYLPGAYALARRKSPTWEIYMLFPATEQRQQAEIARIEAADIRYAMTSIDRVDGRLDLGIEQTHPLLSAYIAHCFNDVAKISIAPRLTIRTRGPRPCKRFGRDQQSRMARSPANNVTS